MAAVTRVLGAEMSAYLSTYAFRHDAVTRHLIEVTGQLDKADYQVSPEQAGLLTLLTQLCSARRGLELGAFTGLSAIAIARGLPPDGLLITCDVNQEYAEIAREHWRLSGLQDKISLQMKPARELLSDLINNDQAGTFDIVFIDAVKSEYEYYYDCAKKLVRTGGLIVIDNVFRQGRVASSASDAGTVAVRRLNEEILKDQTRQFSMVPIGDGVTIVINT